MSRPRLLDLFCGAGGAAMGYYRAGFDVVGVDIKPQKHYPFEFVQADALEYAREHGAEFDAIHASPPCQRYSTMTKKWNRQNNHPDLVEPCRIELQKLSIQYVIENVEGAPLINAVTLCGSMFGLGVKRLRQYLKRHRQFETSFDLWPPATCNHTGRAVAVYGHSGGSSKRDGISFGGIDTWREAMCIDWMTGDELSEAIPPAYTEFIGRYLLQAVTDSPRPGTGADVSESAEYDMKGCANV